MSTDLYQSFADTYAEALIVFQQTGIDRYLWYFDGQFVHSTDDELGIEQSNHRVIDIDKYALEKAMTLPGAGRFLRGAIHAEALRVASYWVDLLGPVAAWTGSKEKPPRLPDIVGPPQFESFAKAYARAVVEALKSRIPHVVEYDYYAEQFRTGPMAPWFSATDVPFIVSQMTARMIAGELETDPLSPDFAEADIERRAYARAIAGVAREESESIMRQRWWGFQGRDPNYQDAPQT